MDEPHWTNVTKPDAIAELCLPTGDSELDFIHAVLIDLLQRNFIRSVRVDGDSSLRHVATLEGKAYVDEQIAAQLADMMNVIEGYMDDK